MKFPTKFSLDDIEEYFPTNVKRNITAEKVRAFFKTVVEGQYNFLTKYSWSENVYAYYLGDVPRSNDIALPGPFGVDFSFRSQPAFKPAFKPVSIKTSASERPMVLNAIKKDKPDDRDYIYKGPLKDSELPSNVDLREYADEIEDQGHIGSCVGNATSSGLELYCHAQLDKSDINFSRLFVYWNARELGGIEGDNGAYLRDGMKSCNKYGICHEADWKYNEAEVNTKPPHEAYEAAAANVVTKYERIEVSDINSFKSYLSRERKSILIGMGLGEKFLDISGSLSEQNYPAINDSDNKLIGGHAINVVGYDDNLNGGSFIVENSWGTRWGDNGYFALKYSVWEADGWDAWVATEFKYQMDSDDPDYIDVPEPVDPSSDVFVKRQAPAKVTRSDERWEYLEEHLDDIFGANSSSMSTSTPNLKTIFKKGV